MTCKAHVSCNLKLCLHSGIIPNMFEFGLSMNDWITVV